MQIVGPVVVVVQLRQNERSSLFLDGRQELSDKVRLLARVLYARSDAEHVRAPTALEDYPFFYGADNPHNPLWLHIGQVVADPGLLAFGIPDGTWHFTEDDLAWGRFSVKDAKEIINHLWEERIEVREWHQRRADRLQNRGLWARIRNKPILDWED